MRLPLLPMLIVLIVGAAVDFYIFRRMRSDGYSKRCRMAYAVSAVAGALLLVTIVALPKRAGDDSMLRTIMWMLFTYLSVYLPRYIYAIGALLRQGLHALWRRFSFKWISRSFAALGIVCFGLMWWGALIERYHIDVRRVCVTVADLPAAFDGYRIAQISDLHVGTYGSDTTFISRLVDSVNALQPDIIFFTGDLVNRHSAEALPFAQTLSRLSAPDGVWSVMGNHDYGDYFDWPDEAAHRADVASMRAIRAAMGWHDLANTYTFVRRDTDSIAVIGVENIGDPPFHVYGNLKNAYQNIGDPTVKILLSHNPAHWDRDIADTPEAHIALTLSGHTHAMQIDILGASPAAWRYPHWGGLYTDSLGRHLYVNIGTGEVAFPARIGAAPEITLITLRN